MSTALRICQGTFGRVALLDMDKPLIVHAHPHCHVLIKADGADTSFLVQDRLYPLTDDTAVLVNAWERHSYVHTPVAPRTIILALYIEPGWLSGIEKGLMASASPGFFPRPCVEITPQIRDYANRLALQMLHDAGSGAEHEALLFDLMLRVSERFSEWRTLRGFSFRGPRLPSDFRIRRAMDYLRANVGGEFDMDALAREAGLSRAHFFRLFHETTHLTPGVYFNVLRMEGAIQGLAQPGESVAILSDRLGFSAQSHFTRFFRNHLGIPPSEYRRVVNVVRNGSPAGASLPA